MTSTIPASEAPHWADISESNTITVGDRERDVIDHYGQIVSVPFPGITASGGKLPSLDVDVSRCDVVDESDESQVHVGPYVVSVGAGEGAESVLNSIDDLERFGHALLEATQKVRRFMADEFGDAS